MKNRKKTGLYIHVPFCVRKCPYCDFYSVASSKEKLYEQYADAVIRNIKRYVRENPEIFFETVYFGGGTPSLLPVYLYEKIMSEISLYSAHITVNPVKLPNALASFIASLGPP